jgi:hypothetical protein
MSTTNAGVLIVLILAVVVIIAFLLFLRGIKTKNQKQKALAIPVWILMPPTAQRRLGEQAGLR